MSLWDGEGYNNDASEELTEEAFFKAMRSIYNQKPKPSGPPEHRIYFSGIGPFVPSKSLSAKIKTMNDPESS